jgi:serine/threonine-protein kinase
LESAGFKVGPTTQSEMSADVDKDRVTRTDPAAGTQLAKGEVVTLFISSGMTQVPDGLVGQPLDAVIQKLNSLGFSTNQAQEHSDTVGNGLVTRTDPPSGTSVQQRSTITVYVSQGKEQVTIPTDITLGSTTYAEAANKLQAAGFKVALDGGADPAKADPSSIVMDINPAPGSQADKGSTVTLKLQAASPSPSSSPSSSKSQ